LTAQAIFLALQVCGSIDDDDDDDDDGQAIMGIRQYPAILGLSLSYVFRIDIT